MDTDNLCARLASLMRRVRHAEAEADISEAIATLKWQQAKIVECSRLWAEQTAARAHAEAERDRLLDQSCSEEELAADRAALERFQQRLARDLRDAEERGRVTTRIEWRGYLRKAIGRGRALRAERDALLTYHAAHTMCERRVSALRKTLEWYADEKHWIQGTLLMGEHEELGEVTGAAIGRGGMAGEFGLAPNCKCGQCYDYWYADNGDRARAALKEGRGS